MMDISEDTSRRQARLASEQRAQAVGVSGEFLHLPAKRIPRAEGKESSRLPIKYRLVNRMLSRRRRFELFELVICSNFRSETVFLLKATDLTRTLMSKYDSMKAEGPMYFSGKEGAVELRELFEELRDIATSVVQRRSSTQWLLMLRRAFIAPFDGVSMAPDWFIESFIRRSSTPNQDQRLYGRRHKSNPSDLKDLHDLIMVTSAMWHVGRAFRTVVKGLVVTIARSPLFVGATAQTDPQVVDAISLFETRRQRKYRDSQLEPSPYSGTVRRRFAPSPKECPYEGAFAGFYEYGSADDRHKSALRWRTHFRPSFRDPAELLDRPTSQPPSIKSLAAAVALNACWQDIGLNRGHRIRPPKGNWSLWGVHALDLAKLSERLTRFTPYALPLQPSWTPEAALAALRSTSMELDWVDSDLAVILPLTDQLVLVDLIAGTSAVDSPYRRPTDGSVVTEWTTHFEDQVQSAIDSSDWKPRESVRSLRHRTLRRNDGSAITEIDAIAMRDGVLLLVSVKAWTQPEMLEFGEFGSIDHRVIDVENAIKDWSDKIVELAEHPAIKVVSEGARVVGVVVSPEVQYVLPGIATAEVLPGLLAKRIEL